MVWRFQSVPGTQHCSALQPMFSVLTTPLQPDKASGGQISRRVISGEDKMGQATAK
uniref:Uncharacterized protein n=1 Tax=Arundo donax TaxID=35708 RepID=A0A0A9ADC0_ARUDO